MRRISGLAHGGVILLPLWLLPLWLLPLWLLPLWLLPLWFLPLSLEAATRYETYSALGDSITYGIGVSSACQPAAPTAVPPACRDAKNYPALVAAQIAASSGEAVEFQNLGISGATTQTIIAQELQNLSPSAQLVSLYIGTNDIVHIARSTETFAQFQSDYRRILQTISKTAPAAQVVLINVPNGSFLPSASGVSPLELKRRDSASRDIHSFIHSLAVGNSTLIEVDLGCSSQSYNPTLLHDGLHPNDSGAQWMAQKIAQAILQHSKTASELSCAPFY